MTRKTFTHDLEIKQGEDFAEVWTWAIDGTTVDLTGAVAAMQLRRTPGQAVIATPVVVLGGTAGTISYSIPAATTALLTGMGTYDIFITYADGSKQCIMEGKFKVTTRVTQ